MTIDIKTFGEVFTVLPHKKNEKYAAVFTFPNEDHLPSRTSYNLGRGNLGERPSVISSFCAVHDSPPRYRLGLAVQPASWVLELLAATMLAVEGDTISFELNQAQPGADYILSAHYGRLMGSRQICAVTAGSVPQEG